MPIVAEGDAIPPDGGASCYPVNLGSHLRLPAAPSELQEVLVGAAKEALDFGTDISSPRVGTIWIGIALGIQVQGMPGGSRHRVKG